MIKLFKGLFVEDRIKVTAAVAVFVLVIVSEMVYCYVLFQDNKALKLKVEHPVVIEKPTTKVKYVERVVTKQSEPLTLLLEREVEIEKKEGTIIDTRHALISPNTRHQWSVGVVYDGTVGGMVSHNIYKTIEIGAVGTGKTVGALLTVKF